MHRSSHAISCEHTFVASHVIELWEMVGETRTLFTPACLNCGWVGSDGTRGEAEEEGLMHERGERHPWQLRPGSATPWRPGDPTTRERPTA
jgi:hypothetical protein